MSRRTGIAGSTLLAAAALLSGCSGDDTTFLPPEVEAVQVVTPEFDGSLEPAAAVLALVPRDVDTLTVTDYEQVRLQMGLPDLTTADKKKDRTSFWARAESDRPLLSPGMLRASEPQLVKPYGLSQLDVAWEAHFYDASDQESGFVLAFRDGTDMSTVQDAVDAGVAPLAGANVDSARGLVTSGTTSDGDQSWGADETARELVGLPANSTYVSHGCLDEPLSGELDELDVYSVQFEGTLATARLGEDRMDLFTRMRLGSQVAEFQSAYEGGVADPLTGRIGYEMTDPAAAAAMALADRLPFAACA